MEVGVLWYGNKECCGNAKRPGFFDVSHSAEKEENDQLGLFCKPLPGGGACTPFTIPRQDWKLFAEGKCKLLPCINWRALTWGNCMLLPGGGRIPYDRSTGENLFWEVFSVNTCTLKDEGTAASAFLLGISELILFWCATEILLFWVSLRWLNLSWGGRTRVSMLTVLYYVSTLNNPGWKMMRNIEQKMF